MNDENIQSELKKYNVTVTRRVIKTQEYSVDNMDIYGEKQKEEQGGHKK